MSSSDVQLLRRPLPPRHTPSHGSTAEPIPSQLQQEGNEWSNHDNAPPQYNSLLSSLRDLLPVEFPIMPYQIINSFPSRPPRVIHKSLILDLLTEDPRYTRPPPDFLHPTGSESGPGQTSQSETRGVQYLSRCNYRKFVDHFLSELHDGRQREVARQVLRCEQLPQVERRVPQWQSVCESAAADRIRLCVRLQGDDQCLYTADEKQADTDPVVLSFQGRVCRSHSPSLAPISPSEHAVAECLKKGGSNLNLKAHFIHQLPDLSPLIATLCYLNLSFNDFSLFPVKVCELTKLEVLKLRENPIEEIPAQIQKLTNLKTLVISFCKLTALPSQLYHLPSLRHLDISHNIINHLSDDIRNLRSLRYLNIQGNQLTDLPAGLLRLPLARLKLDTGGTHSWLSQQNTHSHQTCPVCL